MIIKLIHRLNVLIYLKKKHFGNSNGTSVGPTCFSAFRLWIKQRSSLVNPTVATILQFIRIQRDLLPTGRRRLRNDDVIYWKWYV